MLLVVLLLLPCVSQAPDGEALDIYTHFPSPRSLRKVLSVWKNMQDGFIKLWSDEVSHSGESHKRTMYTEAAGGLEESQARYMRRLWQVVIIILNSVVRYRGVPCTHERSLVTVEIFDVRTHALLR